MCLLLLVCTFLLHVSYDHRFYGCEKKRFCGGTQVCLIFDVTDKTTLLLDVCASHCHSFSSHIIVCVSRNKPYCKLVEPE